MATQAKDLMTSPAVTVRADEDLQTAASRMLQHGIGSLVVVDAAGKALAVLTERDFMADEQGVPFSTFQMPKLFGRWVGVEGLQAIYDTAKGLPVSQVARRPLVAARPEDLAERVVDLMLTHDVKHVPVLDASGRPLGMVARHDLLRLLHRP